MNLQEWNSDAHLPIVQAWADEDPDIRQLVGSTVTDKALDGVVPERGVVVDDKDEPVAMFGMRRMGDRFAVVHVLGSPRRKTLGDMAAIDRAYDIAEQHAKSVGILVLYAMIPTDKTESVRMAEHRGYNQLPYVQMVKALT